MPQIIKKKIEKRYGCGKAIRRAVIVLFLILCWRCDAAFERRARGARLEGMGRASTALRWDLWAVNHNPSLAGTCGRYASVFAAPSVFGMRELAAFGALWTDTFASVGIAAIIESTGNEMYRETQSGAVASIPLGETLRVGGAVRYHHVSISRYGNDACVSVDAGVEWRSGDALSVAAAVTNLNQARIGNSVQERTPVTLALGAAVRLAEDVLVSADLYKDALFPAAVRAGLEFRPLLALAFRAGANTNPAIFTCGLGVQWGGLDIDYAVASHPDLGLSHTLSIAFQLSKDHDSE